MNLITCAGCNTAYSEEQIVQKNNNSYCSACAENLSGELPAIAISQNVDTSVPDSTCAFCKQNFGYSELTKLGAFPICESCNVNLNKQIFPLWVKGFFISVLVLVLFSGFWNWRFFAAYKELKLANKSFAAGKTAEAAKTMQEASNNVSEVQILADLAHYYTGVDYMLKDKATLALKEFNKCSESLPVDFRLNEVKMQAGMSVSYDRGDYQGFLKSAKEFLRSDTSLSDSWGSVASAYACLYAKNGIDSLRALSLANLKRARAIDDTSAEAKNYAGRILYRLDSRQIISKEQFDKIFPKGYTSK